MKRSLPFHPRPLVVLAAVVVTLCASIAWAQTSVRGATAPLPGRSATSPPASPALASTPATAGSAVNPRPTDRNPVAGTPGGGTAALPAGAPSPSGLASPSPFPAGMAPTSIAAPGTSAAITAPTAVSPSLAGSSTAGGVTSSTRGVVIVPGSNVPTATNTQPLAGGAVGPAGTAAAVNDPNGPVAAGNAGAAVSVGTPGAAAGNVVVVPGTTGADAASGAAVVGGAAGGLTGGVPSVSPTGTARGPLTAVDIVRLFSQADGNSDGLLTRAEALRLPLSTMTFEDMDTNRDGSVSRSEYEESLR